MLAILGVLVACVAVLLFQTRAYRSRLRRLESSLLSLRHQADERAVALDYLVRARVVDYVYDYVGYRISVRTGSDDEVSRIMVFAPPEDKDIICKRITLVEGAKAPPGASSVHDFGFDAAVFAPLPDLVDGDAVSAADPLEDAAWHFESHPWVLDVPSDETAEVRAILVFTPMISQRRRLAMRYHWPGVFPELRLGSSVSRGHFSTLKHARILEYSVSLPPGSPQATLTLHPPGERDPVVSAVKDDALVCTIADAPRGTYRVVLRVGSSAAA